MDCLCYPVWFFIMKEIWKDISGYKGLYQISNKGRVKSFRQNSPRVLKNNDNGNGYLIVHFKVKNIRKPKYIHRLVSVAFIINTYNKQEVNHKDGNKHNNSVNNLEWCTRSENIRHSFRTGLRKAPIGQLGLTGSKSVLSKPVLQFTTDGKFIKEHEGMRDATRKTGIARDGIRRSCNGEKGYSGGFKWKYK